jgi:replicative DNA helicase
VVKTEELPGRIPPHNLDAERAVIGALMLAGERIPEVSELITPDDFHDPRHRVLFQSLLFLSEQGLPVDFIHLGEVLRDGGKFQAVGGHEYMLELASRVTSAAHLGFHARLLADAATLRRLIQGATAIVDEAYATPLGGEGVRALLDQSEQKIFDVARASNPGSADPIRDAIAETFKAMDARSHHGLTGLATGFHDLDDKLCGLNKGDLLIIAARPSMGKTAFVLNIAAHAALSHPEWLSGRRPTVLLFSLEMGKQQIAMRMLCTRAAVDAHKLRTGRIPEEDYPLLNEAAGELSNAGLFIDDTPGITVMGLRGRARRVMAKHGLDLVIVDYLQLMSHPGAESRQLEISAISRSLKALARELSVPVIALSQLSRAVEARDKKRPMLSDLRESGSIEQDADVVMMLYRPEYYLGEDTPPEDRGKAEVIIAKHRNGPTGEVKLWFRQNIMRFENPAPTVAEAIYTGAP